MVGRMGGYNLRKTLWPPPMNFFFRNWRKSLKQLLEKKSASRKKKLLEIGIWKKILLRGREKSFKLVLEYSKSLWIYCYLYTIGKGILERVLEIMWKIKKRYLKKVLEFFSKLVEVHEKVLEKITWNIFGPNDTLKVAVWE